MRSFTICYINSCPATKCNFRRLLIIFANSLDPDQARQNVGHDLDPKLFDSDGIPKI